MRRWLVVLAIVLLPTWTWAEGFVEGLVVGTTCPITWQVSITPGVTAYRLYVSRRKGHYDRTHPAATIAAPTTTATCLDLGLAVDGQYYLVATAVVGHAGESELFSNEEAFYRDTTIPMPPGIPLGY